MEIVILFNPILSSHHFDFSNYVFLSEGSFVLLEQNSNLCSQLPIEALPWVIFESVPCKNLQAAFLATLEGNSKGSINTLKQLVYTKFIQCKETRVCFQ